MPWAWSPFCFLSSQTWDGRLPGSSLRLNCLLVNASAPLTHTPQVDPEFSKMGKKMLPDSKLSLIMNKLLFLSPYLILFKVLTQLGKIRISFSL